MDPILQRNNADRMLQMQSVKWDGMYSFRALAPISKHPLKVFVFATDSDHMLTFWETYFS